MAGFAKINEFINYDIFVEEKERIRENAKPKTFGFGGESTEMSDMCTSVSDMY